MVWYWLLDDRLSPLGLFQAHNFFFLRPLQLGKNLNPQILDQTFHDVGSCLSFGILTRFA